MVKHDVLKGVSAKLDGCSMKDIDAVLGAYSEFIVETLNANKDEKVPFPGVGAFTVKHVGERSGVSAIGEKKAWTVPAHDEIKFTVAKSVKTIA
jgi:nucleoid DNA-binding protein